MHGFFLFPSSLYSPGMVQLEAAHKVRSPWDKGVSSQTPPEVVMLQCVSEERGDANRVSPRACGGETVFTAGLRLGDFIHLSVVVTEFVLSVSHSFLCLFVANCKPYTVHH